MTSLRTDLRQPEWQAAVRAYVADVVVSVERRVVANGAWLSDNARKRNGYRETPGTKFLYDVVLTNGTADEALAEVAEWELEGHGCTRRKDAEAAAERALASLTAYLEAGFWDVVDERESPLAEAVYWSLG